MGLIHLSLQSLEIFSATLAIFDHVCVTHSDCKLVSLFFVCCNNSVTAFVIQYVEQNHTFKQSNICRNSSANIQMKH